MSTTTQFFGMTLPELGDAADVRVLNEAFEALDTLLGAFGVEDTDSVRADALAAYLNAMPRNLGGRTIVLTVTADTGAIADDLVFDFFNNGVLSVVFQNNNGGTEGTTCNHAVSIKNATATISLVNTWLVSSSTAFAVDIANSPNVNFLGEKARFHGETSTGTVVLTIRNNACVYAETADGYVEVRAKTEQHACEICYGGRLVINGYLKPSVTIRAAHVFLGGVLVCSASQRPNYVKVTNGGQMIAPYTRIPIERLEVDAEDKIMQPTPNFVATGVQGTYYDQKVVYHQGELVDERDAVTAAVAYKNGSVYVYIIGGEIETDEPECYLNDVDSQSPFPPHVGNFNGAHVKTNESVSVEYLPSW